MFDIPDGTGLTTKDEIKEYLSVLEDFRNRWGYIQLNYLYNDYICSSFVQGVNGWCHPDGTIEYHYNIGKWPTVEEILEDLHKLIDAFPFLELEVTVFDDEYCEESIVPLVSFLVRGGEVELIDPSERDIHQEFGRERWEYSKAETERNMMKVIFRGYDSSISYGVLEEWSKLYWR